jgi:quercetin dioxygenase-like cupin family protein
MNRTLKPSLRNAVHALFAVLALVTTGSVAVAQSEDVFQVVYQTSTEVNTVPGDFRLVTLVIDFPPGTWTPLHFHGADGLVTVLEGEVTLEVLGQEPRTFQPGDMWKEHVGLPHRAGNDSDAPARITVTFIAQVDAPITVPLE